MSFKKKHLKLTEAQEKYKGRLIEEFKYSEQEAEKVAKLNSEGSLYDVLKDLRRHQKIFVIKDNVIVKEISAGSGAFESIDDVEKFLDFLTKQEKIHEYFQKYLHQGGFFRLAEMLLSNYFTPHTTFEKDNYVATFTLEKDGSIGFEETFDIQGIIIPATGAEYKTSSGNSIASFSLKSNIKLVNNEIDHKYGDLNVNVHDKIVGKFFEDPRGKFVEFLSWIKEILHSFIDKIEKEQREARAKIPSPNKRF